MCSKTLKFGVLQVGYVGNHVTHLLTDGVVSPRNLNRADIDFFGFNLRRLPQFGDIFLVGSYPSSTYNALQATFKRNLAMGLQFNFNYTWAHAIDDVVGFFKDYQDEFNTRGERASSDQDVRHNFTFDASYDIPGQAVLGALLRDGSQAAGSCQPSRSSERRCP